jgi:hypothetical protein
MNIDPPVKERPDTEPKPGTPHPDTEPKPGTGDKTPETTYPPADAE